MLMYTQKQRRKWNAHQKVEAQLRVKVYIFAAKRRLTACARAFITPMYDWNSHLISIWAFAYLIEPTFFIALYLWDFFKVVAVSDPRRLNVCICDAVTRDSFTRSWSHTIRHNDPTVASKFSPRGLKWQAAQSMNYPLDVLSIAFVKKKDEMGYGMAKVFDIVIPVVGLKLIAWYRLNVM